MEKRKREEEEEEEDVDTSNAYARLLWEHRSKRFVFHKPEDNGPNGLVSLVLWHVLSLARTHGMYR